MYDDDSLLNDTQKLVIGLGSALCGVLFFVALLIVLV